jgi:hypothetical protein
MPRITLRVTEEMYKQINDLADQQVDSLSTVAKQLISAGLQELDTNTAGSGSDIYTQISLESLYLLKKLMYERFDYSQTDFEKVHTAARAKIKAKQQQASSEKV